MPRADSQGGFGVGGTQGPGANAGGGDPGPRGRWAPSGGSTSQCPQRQKKLGGGEGVYKGSSAPCTMLDYDVLLWCLKLFPQTFPVVVPIASAPSGCLFIAKSCPLPGSALQTTLSSTQLLFATGDSLFRVECSELRCRSCMQFLLCPASLRPSAAFSCDPPKFLVFPLHEGVFLNEGTSHHLQLPATFFGLFFYSSFLFSSSSSILLGVYRYCSAGALWELFHLSTCFR